MIELRNVRFRWHHDAPLSLDIPTFKVNAGERVFLEGPSGTGKTTLLNVLGGVVLPEIGSVEVNSVNLIALNSAKRDAFRADHIGMIFQIFNLIPYLSAVDNIMLPCRFSQRRNENAKNKSSSAKEEALRLLMRMQLNQKEVIQAPSFELSIGQQQRVAAARALIGSPELIVADEPTSALDYGVRQIFINLLFDEIASAGATLVFVSHDPSFADQFDRRIKLTEINEVT